MYKGHNKIEYVNQKLKTMKKIVTSSFLCINELMGQSQIIEIIIKYILPRNSFAFSCIESKFAMEFPWDKSHQPFTLLLWQESKTLITPLSLTVLNLHLSWRFLGTKDINHIPHCYGNSLAMATRVVQ